MAETWKGHDDSRRVFPFHFPVVIVGTKFDVLQN